MIMTSRSGDIHSLHDSDAGSDIDVRTDDDDDGKWQLWRWPGYVLIRA